MVQLQFGICSQLPSQPSHSPSQPSRSGRALPGPGVVRSVPPATDDFAVDRCVDLLTEDEVALVRARGAAEAGPRPLLGLLVEGHHGEVAPGGRRAVVSPVIARGEPDAGLQRVVLSGGAREPEKLARLLAPDRGWLRQGDAGKKQGSGDGERLRKVFHVCTSVELRWRWPGNSVFSGFHREAVAGGPAISLDDAKKKTEAGGLSRRSRARP